MVVLMESVWTFFIFLTMVGMIEGNGRQHWWGGGWCKCIGGVLPKAKYLVFVCCFESRLFGRDSALESTFLTLVFGLMGGMPLASVFK